MKFGQERRGALWLTVYSDFITNMVLFFLILYTTTRVTHEQQQDILRNIQDTMSGEERSAVLIEREARERIEDMIANQDLEDFAMVSMDEKRIRIVLREAITFASGDDTLVSQSYPVLDEIINIIKDLPNNIIIEGHTDNVPITMGRRFFSNWELSGARAVSVLNYMKEKGIDPERIRAVGYGEYRPVFSNENPRGRAMNRRVEITIERI